MSIPCKLKKKYPDSPYPDCFDEDICQMCAHTWSCSEKAIKPKIQKFTQELREDGTMWEIKRDIILSRTKAEGDIFGYLIELIETEKERLIKKYSMPRYKKYWGITSFIEEEYKKCIKDLYKAWQKNVDGHKKELDRLKFKVDIWRDYRQRKWQKKIEWAKEYPIDFMIDFNSKNKALCIFHPEIHPSMHYYRDGNYVYCFGCHKIADAIEVKMVLEGLSFKNAVRALQGGELQRRK